MRLCMDRAGLLAEDQTGCQLALRLWTAPSRGRGTSAPLSLGTPPVSTRISGETMRDAIGNKERWERRVRLPKILVLTWATAAAAIIDDMEAAASTA